MTKSSMALALSRGLLDEVIDQCDLAKTLPYPKSRLVALMDAKESMDEAIRILKEARDGN